MGKASNEALVEEAIVADPKPSKEALADEVVGVELTEAAQPALEVKSTEEQLSAPAAEMVDDTAEAERLQAELDQILRETSALEEECKGLNQNISSLRVANADLNIEMMRIEGASRTRPTSSQTRPGSSGSQQGGYSHKMSQMSEDASSGQRRRPRSNSESRPEGSHLKVHLVGDARGPRL